MKNQDYNCEISVKVPANEAAECISDVGAWWAADFKGKTHGLNDTFTVRFGETFADYKIIELIPDKRIVWQVVDCYLHLLEDPKEWVNTKIIWEISSGDNSTKISMTHAGLVPGIECYNDCKAGWNFFIKESLFKLTTEGKGLPGIGIRSTISSSGRTYKGILFSKHDPLPNFPGEHILVDVREIKVEHIISSYAACKLDKANFDSQQLKGDHYMLIEDRSQFENISVLKDILQTVK